MTACDSDFDRALATYYTAPRRTRDAVHTEFVDTMALAACNGPCRQGREGCKTPDACRIPDDSFAVVRGLFAWPTIASAALVVGAIAAAVRWWPF